MTGKKVIINGDKTGRVQLPKKKAPAKLTPESLGVNRVTALYPLEPTTIEESVLDKAITDAIRKRTHQKK